MPFRFFNFQFVFSGATVPYPLKIVAYALPTNRYIALKGIPPSVIVSLVGPEVVLLPSDFDGFIVERSDDQGLTWSDVSGVVRDSYFFVDSPIAVVVSQYRAKMRVVTGGVSVAGPVVSVSSGAWTDADKLGVTEMDMSTGLSIRRLPRDLAFPQGFDSEPHEGMSISEGSMVGGYGTGAWYLRTVEYDPPVVKNHAPACGTPAVLLPFTVMTFDIQDEPYPVGGSGIDDASYYITLSVASQLAGSPLTVRQGAAQPSAPNITCVIVPGVDPLLDRSVTITVPAGYIGSDDLVNIMVSVADLDGNRVVDNCSFTMEHIDTDPPIIRDEGPVCDLGLTPGDTGRAPLDTSFTFKVEDPDSGVDLTTLQVEYGSTPVGPWTLVLQNGATFLGGFTGSVISDGANGYDVTITRPVADPFWPADSQVCFRIRVDDNSANSEERICCFKTEEEAFIARVVPIAEDILFVEFSVPMLDGVALRNVENYEIQILDAEDPVRVRSVLPQRFIPPVDPEELVNRLGVGDPTFVFLDTTPHTFWGKYRLITSNLESRYGQQMGSTGRQADYVGRRTKVDDGRDTMSADTSRQDSLIRRIMVGIFHSDEIIGGTFFLDDWEE